MVAVVMCHAASELTVIAQQDHAGCAGLRRHRNRASPAIAERLERLPDKTDQPVKIIVAEGRALKVAAHLINVALPPLRINRKQGIRPRRDAERGVDYDAAFRGLPRFFTPLSDGFAVVSGKTWAAGEADDGSSAPAA